MEDIASRVISLRTAQHISQRELARRCEVSQATIANIERGRTQEIKGYVLEDLSRELKATPGLILNGPDSREDHESSMMETEITTIFKSLSMEERETMLRVMRSVSRAGTKTKQEAGEPVNKDAAITRY